MKVAFDVMELITLKHFDGTKTQTFRYGPDSNNEIRNNIPKELREYPPYYYKNKKLFRFRHLAIFRTWTKAVYEQVAKLD